MTTPHQPHRIGRRLFLAGDGEAPSFTGTSLDVELEADPGTAHVSSLDVHGLE